MAVALQVKRADCVEEALGPGADPILRADTAPQMGSDPGGEGGAEMLLKEQERTAVGRALQLLDERLAPLWDMIGIGLWTCSPPVYLRLEFQYIRAAKRKAVFFVSGVSWPSAGQGVELMLTKHVHKPEDYTGPYAGFGTDVNFRGAGYGVGLSGSFPPGAGLPVGASIGLSSPGANLWVGEYRLIGGW